MVVCIIVIARAKLRLAKPMVPTLPVLLEREILASILVIIFLLFLLSILFDRGGFRHFIVVHYVPTNPQIWEEKAKFIRFKCGEWNIDIVVGGVLHR